MGSQQNKSTICNYGLFLYCSYLSQQHLLVFWYLVFVSGELLVIKGARFVYFLLYFY